MVSRRHLSHRLALLGLPILLALTLTAGPAGGKASSVRFVSGTLRVVQGNRASVGVAVSPAGVPCSLTVRYADGTLQKGLGTRRALSGRTTWRWVVPRSTRPGPATISVSCSRAGTASRRLMVIGQVLALKINVVKTGFSARPMSFGGTRVSWGVVLENSSKTHNAVDVNVLANFVMDDNRLIGSAGQRVSEIRAGTQHAVGGELNFQGSAPIARLEVVAQVRERSPKTRRIPGLSSVRVVEDPFDRGWVGSVEGEIQNDDVLRMEFARLTTVVLDADGNVLGGSSGFASASLPPGARQFFKIFGSMAAIPIGKAASALVSVEPTYR